jgi:uncharacterized membrane protein
MKISQSTKDKACLYAALILVAASICYWSAFAINAYYTFHSYWDVGIYAYDMYYHIHYPAIVHGLQYLSFGQHMAPDQLLVLPLFYLYQSSLTLMIVQAGVLSLAGLILFMIGRRILKSSFFGLLLCLAYLLNPGMHGMLLIDYHAEFLIIPFLLLTFYFFMQRRRTLFFLSLLLLLCTLETAAFVALALGIGLLVYEFRYDVREKAKLRNERIKLAWSIVLFSLVAMVLYGCAGSALGSGYANGAYPNLPPQLQVTNFGVVQISGITSSLQGQQPAAAGWVPPGYTLYALCVVFLGFGIGALLIPEVTFILALPWLVEGFMLNRVTFFLIWYQYFSYVIGGAMIATVLAVLAVRQKSNRLTHLLGRLKQQPEGAVYRSLLVFSLVVFMVSPLFLISNAIDNPVQSFLFQTSTAQLSQIKQLYYVMGLIPPNASVVSAIPAISHLAERSELAPMGANSLWFKPQYLLVELNSTVGSPPAPESSFNQTAMDQKVLAGADYYLYARNGSAELYRLANLSDS